MKQRSTSDCCRSLLLMLAVMVVASGQWCHASGSDDILLAGGQLVDGSGKAAYPADIVISGDRIAEIVPPGSFNGDAVKTIDVSGRTLAPGFIDLHAHITNLHESPHAENFLRQGITTTVNSLHSHDQPWPLAEYTATLRVAPNVAYYAGHTWIRKQVMGLDDRVPTDKELDEMRYLVEQSMQQGAFGLSTGLEYVPAVYASTEEIIELAKVAARYGGIYNTHLRDEGPRVIEAFNETIRIAREANIPAHINHHKLAGSAQFGWSKRTLSMIDTARADGLDITHDLYPYSAFSTYSDILFPAWALAGGDEQFAKRIRHPDTRQRIESEMRVIFPQQTGGGFDSIQFRELTAFPEYKGRTLADLLQQHKQAQDLDSAIDLLIDLQLGGGFIGIFHSMSEEDIERIMLHPASMIESDGDLVQPGQGYPHPRSYGAFPRVLARYVRERGTLSLEQAVHKMTAMPAKRLGLTDRGQLKKGMFADIVVFDPATIQDLSRYTDPHHYSNGIEYLFVNGVTVIDDNEMTDALPGRVLSLPELTDRETAKREIRALADDVWAADVAESTELRLMAGLPITKFEDLTLEQHRKSLLDKAEWRARLNKINAEALDGDELVTYEVLSFQLENDGTNDSDFWLTFDITPYVGPYKFQFAQQALATHVFEDTEGGHNYLKLVGEYVDMIDQLSAKVKGQVERNIYLPKPALSAARSSWKGLKQATPIALAVSDDRLSALDEEERKLFQASLDSLVQGRVMGSYDALLGLIGEEYESMAPERVGLGQYEGGDAVYRRRIRKQTTLELTPEEIHARGQKAVAEISRNMQAIRDELGFAGTAREFHDQLKSNPRFIAKTPREVEARYMSFIERIEPRLDDYFRMRPEAAYGVRRLPLESEAGMTFGYYNPPSAAEPVGYYFYNGSDLANRSLIGAGPLIYHELLPGHHFHIATQQENEALQDLRKNNFDTAFTEGWAEYAASLAVEMNLYDDPYDMYGVYIMQIFLAARLVVDTGMNALEWSLEDARQFLREHVYQSDVEIASELLRYSTSIPAQALGYRLGYEKIWELRHRAEAALGDEFDLRDFHDVVLSDGTKPLGVLEAKVDRYIAETGKALADPVKTTVLEGTEDQKLSYLLALDFLEKSTKQGFQLDAEFVALAIRNEQSGVPLPMSTGEYMALVGLKREIIAKHEKVWRALGEKNLAAGNAYLEQMALQEGVITTDSGLQYKVIRHGSGKTPSLDDVARIHYRGRFLNGTEFDNSFKRGAPVDFPVAKVRPGLTEALQLMKEGAKIELYVPPHLSYGEEGNGPIGPNEVLIFEVELIEVLD